ncbi:MAG TPA: PKD domain-containing protein, partial [Desulfobacterales bacterium]|nr:PKD domain-containing protein [Desulfobacterales bacterium]
DTSTDRIVHLAANGTKLTESAPLSVLGAPITLIPAGGDAARFPTALALADRTNIDVGQTVKFTGVGRDSDGTIIRYRWDFEGDGTFDATATDSGITEHAYSSTGIFTPIFEVMDNDHLTAVDHRLVIRVGKLTAKATADVTSGEAPLTVSFDGSFTDPLNGRVDSFQWDFDGDGIFDYYSDSSPKVSYTYARQGTYTAILKVTDGPHSAIDSLTITVTKSAPKVTPYAIPSSGSSPLAVDFSADAQDPDGKIVLYQWDFEDDGAVDWSSVSSADATHVYATPGTYTSRITVTDNDGQTSSGTVDITVSAPPPAPKATAAPDKGHAPLTVAFSATGSTAPAGTISKYEWDFGDCQILFRDDAENGTTNWQADAPWGTTTTVWRSSNHAFTDSPAGGYATDANVSLTLKAPLDLSATTTATLSFWQRYSLGSYTSLLAEVSTDGGSTWNTLDHLVGSSLIQLAWTRISLDLSPYLPADQLLIRFRLSPGYYAQPGDGWYIDDIQIASCAESWTASADGTASHTYNTPGEFTARLRLTDSAGGQATATVPIQALPTSTPLLALIASPTSGLAPLAVTLTPTVTASGTVTNYAWNFGEDILWTATIQQISRRWTLTGRELAALSADYISTMTVDPADGSLWFGDRNTDVIAHASPSGAQLAKWSLSDPLAIEVDGDSIWVLQRTSLRRFRKDGAPLASIFGLNTYTAHMALDQGAGVLWVWLSNPRQLIRLDTTAPDGYDV